MDGRGEVYQAVEDLNYFLLDGMSGEHIEVCFVYSTDSWVESVQFCGLQVYNDESSDRGWDEDKDDYARTVKEQIMYEVKKKLLFANKFLVRYADECKKLTEISEDT